MSIHLVSMVWKTEFGSPHIKAVATKLADCANDEGENIWPSVERIARETEISKRAVQNALAALREMQFIRLVEDGGHGRGSTNVYEINLAVLARMKLETQRKWAEQDALKKSAPRASLRQRKGARGAFKGAPGAFKGAPGAPEPSLTVIEPSISIPQPEVSTAENQKPPTRATAEQFENFWRAYPLKKGKAKAREKFLALSPDDAGAAVRGALGYAAECAAAKREAQYIKWPEGWLSARRFEDYAAPSVEDLTGPNGERWGWWTGKEDKLRALGPDHWRSAIDSLRPNGTWPWWKLGPPPGHADCLVPDAIIAERGYAEKYRGSITVG